MHGVLTGRELRKQVLVDLGDLVEGCISFHVQGGVGDVNDLLADHAGELVRTFHSLAVAVDEGALQNLVLMDPLSLHELGVEFDELPLLHIVGVVVGVDLVHLRHDVSLRTTEVLFKLLEEGILGE